MTDKTPNRAVSATGEGPATAETITLFLFLAVSYESGKLAESSIFCIPQFLNKVPLRPSNHKRSSPTPMS